MSSKKKITIGLFGFGVVGEGVYKVLQQTPSLEASIKKICVKNPLKKRNAPSNLFTTDQSELLFDPEINVIVEVINDTKAAFQISKTALENGKSVVSASKKMIAEHFSELLELQNQSKKSFLYEASACASIPIIRNLEEYFDNDLLYGIQAIVNGSTNFILTKIHEEKLEFSQALLLAQQLGFAESNPSLDIEGIDAANKWSILLAHAYGIIAAPNELLFSGIQNINRGDSVIANEKSQQIKLVAHAQKLQNGKVAAFVLPLFVNQNDPLSFVKNEYNGVVIESGIADKQFLYGKGAGGYPTASAILSDISALKYDYRYEYKKLYQQQSLQLTEDYSLKVYVSFTSWENIPKEKFEWIEEWHAREERKYLIGTISVKELINNSWWKENGTSLVLTANPIIEDSGLRKIKKKSLELAGVSF